MSYSAFTVSISGLASRITTPVSVRQSELFCTMNNLQSRSMEAKALWDTGASLSAISQRLAAELALKPIDTIEMVGIGGRHTANTYRVDIQLPNEFSVLNVRVADFLTNSDFDIIIGMNIITRGDFAITNCNIKTIASFRIPPDTVHIDYVKTGSKTS